MSFPQATGQVMPGLRAVGKLTAPLVISQEHDMKLFRPPTPPDTISDDQMADLRRRAIKAHPEKARFDTSKEAAAKRHAQNLQHERRTQS